MKKMILSLSIAAAALLFCSQHSNAATIASSLAYSSFSLADSNGGIGGNNNNVQFFDGIGGTPGPAFPQEPFGTSLYLRERTTTPAERRVQANVVFDVSLFTSPVASATLDFSAYVINGAVSTISVSRLDAAMSFGAASSLTQTQAASTFGPLTAGVFSVDVTAIVNSWIGGAANNGFLLSIDNRQNDGFGIADDAGDGTVIALNTIPEPSSAILLALGGLAILRRRR